MPGIDGRDGQHGLPGYKGDSADDLIPENLIGDPGYVLYYIYLFQKKLYVLLYVNLYL